MKQPKTQGMVIMRWPDGSEKVMGPMSVSHANRFWKLLNAGKDEFGLKSWGVLEHETWKKDRALNQDERRL